LELNEFNNEKRTGFSLEAKQHFGFETPNQYVDASSLHLDD
jgi:hypothetical protein